MWLTICMLMCHYVGIKFQTRVVCFCRRFWWRFQSRFWSELLIKEWGIKHSVMFKTGFVWERRFCRIVSCNVRVGWVHNYRSCTEHPGYFFAVSNWKRNTAWISWMTHSYFAASNVPKHSFHWHSMWHLRQCDPMIAQVLNWHLQLLI